MRITEILLPGRPGSKLRGGGNIVEYVLIIRFKGNLFKKTPDGPCKNYTHMLAIIKKPMGRHEPFIPESRRETTKGIFRFPDNRYFGSTAYEACGSPETPELIAW